VLQGANHFRGPSDLLSTTTTCFRKLIAYIFWCSCCGQNLIQFATHCCPTASTVCAACTLGEPQNSLPKNGHEHYHGSLKHCTHNFSRQYWLFGLLHGGVASLGHIFKIHLSPDQSSYIGLFLRLASVCRAQTIPAPIALKIYQEAHFFTSILSMQTELVIFRSGKKGVYFMFCSFCGLSSDMPNFTCLALPQQCAWTFVTYYFMQSPH
jgi:hypothetical protein